MNVKKRYFYQKAFLLFLTICMLCGCSGKQPLPENTASETSQAYEVYRKEDLDAQKAFSQLCSQIFEDSVTASSLSLHYTLADPASYGITDYPITFGELSVTDMQANISDMRELLRELETLDPMALSNDQQVTFYILKEYLETELTMEGMELYYQPLAPSIGVQAQLPVLLAEYTFYDKDDIDEYLELLSQIDSFFSQIVEFETEKAKAGIFMNENSLDEVLASCEAYLLSPDHNLMNDTFLERLETLSDLTEEEKSAYIARNSEILANDFIPAYQLLKDGLSELRSYCIPEQGICYLPKGKEYYEYLIRSSTYTTSETMDDLKAAMESQINEDLIAISRIVKEHPDVSAKLTDAPVISSDPLVILDSLIQQIDQDFPALPDCSYTLKYVPEALESSLSPAFYLTPPLDRYTSNTIYINNAYTENTDLFSTLAHEGYPGHLYQTVYFLDHCQENVRQILSFSSYSEGWASYVENYSYSLENGLDGQVSQILGHNSSAMLGLHALLDLNVNYYGWNKDQVALYLQKYYGIKDQEVADAMYSTVIATPSNYLEYYVGYLEIVKLRDAAMETLDDKFQLKEFHTFLLNLGPAPFTVIEPYFRSWLVTQQL